MVEYLDKMAQAIDAGDDAELEDLYIECHNWYHGLDASERLEADEAQARWAEVNMWAWFSIALKINELQENAQKTAKESDAPRYYNTEQFMNLIKTSDCEVRVEREGEYYTGYWSHDYNYATIVYLNGEYYICVNGNGTYQPVLVSFENANKAIAWLEKSYSRLLEIERKAKEVEVSKVSEDITLDKTDAFYVIKDTYKSEGPKYRLVTDPWISSEIWIEPENDWAQLIISFSYYGDIHLRDETYHAMMAALKSRHIMKRKFEVHVEKELTRENRQRELDDLIY